MKLELKHLAPYLSYGLKCQYQGQCDSKVNFKMIGIDYGWVTLEFADSQIIEDIIPILRPLSDLTKKIEAGGETFIPALRLAEIKIELGLYEDIAPTIDFNYKVVNKPFGKMLKVSKLGDWVIMLSFTEVYRSQYFILEKLFEWHFDIFSLINNGLALDYNQINA